MNKISLPFDAPQTGFEHEEFVAPSEVEGVAPRRFNGRDREEQLEEFRDNARRVRAEWNAARRRKMEELGIQD